MYYVSSDFCFETLSLVNSCSGDGSIGIFFGSFESGSQSGILCLNWSKLICFSSVAFACQKRDFDVFPVVYSLLHPFS